MELHLCFSDTTPQFRASRHVPLNPHADLEKNKTAILSWMNKSRGVGIERELSGKTKMSYFRRLWVKEPRRSETVLAKKWYTSYTSTRRTCRCGRGALKCSV